MNVCSLSSFRNFRCSSLTSALDATGFELGEIDLRIEGLQSGAEYGEDPADELQSAPPGPAVSRTGDLWLCGRHRVYCGSALDPSAYAALMQGEYAAMVFTDPPYN